MINYLTVDVEDYYQVSAFESIVGHEHWDSYESRVVENTRKILNLLEEYDVKATFFVLGWTAEKYPSLVSEIDNHGHEIACHSYYHRLVYELSPEEFRRDTQKAKSALEKITGNNVVGYRAPSYSITSKSLWALDILEEEGFVYDSSIFPIYHDRYGIPNSPRFSYQHNDKVLEYPISTVLLFGRTIPIAGGGYFRLFPYWFVKMALRRINNIENRPFVFYIHPWELDHEQPRIRGAGMVSRFRHYLNLEKTERRLRMLLGDFSVGPINSPECRTVQI